MTFYRNTNISQAEEYLHTETKNCSCEMSCAVKSPDVYRSLEPHQLNIKETQTTEKTRLQVMLTDNVHTYLSLLIYFLFYLISSSLFFYFPSLQSIIRLIIVQACLSRSQSPAISKLQVLPIIELSRVSLPLCQLKT